MIMHPPEANIFKLELINSSKTAKAEVSFEKFLLLLTRLLFFSYSHFSPEFTDHTERRLSLCFYKFDCTGIPPPRP